MPFKKPSDYDSAKSLGQSDFTPLPKGAYICRIMQIEETKDRNGKPMIHIAFDIIDGEYTNYFMNLFQRRKKNSDKPFEVKWPFEGQMWIPIFDFENPNKTSSKFKGFCTSLEESGTEVWTPNDDFMTQNIKDSEIGIVFCRKEEEYDGKRSWKTKPWGCRSVQSVEEGDVFIPDDKPLPEAHNSGYSGGFNSSYSNNSNSGFESADGFSASSDPIPF